MRQNNEMSFSVRLQLKNQCFILNNSGHESDETVLIFAINACLNFLTRVDK